MRKSVCLPLAAAWLVASCGANDLGLPKGSVAFAPPLVYDTWWHMVEGCSAHTSSMAEVSWFEAPDDASMVVSGREVSGYWDQRHNTIVLKHVAMLDGSLVRHEMLHSVIRSTMHTRRDWLEQYGGVVACVFACVDDAGPFSLPDNTVARVPPDSLVITSVIDPIAATGVVDAGFFRLTVLARNDADHPVVVQLPPSGDAGPSLSFSYAISGYVSMEYNDRAWDAEMTYFGAHQTKRRVFDFIVRPTLDMGSAITPGTYRVRGAFGERMAAPLTLIVEH